MTEKKEAEPEITETVTIAADDLIYWLTLARDTLYRSKTVMSNWHRDGLEKQHIKDAAGVADDLLGREAEKAQGIINELGEMGIMRDSVLVVTVSED